MQKDIEMWKSDQFTDLERRAIKMTMGFFTTADSIVANNLVLAIYKHITSPECRMYLLRQAFEEAREMDVTDPEPRNALEDLVLSEKRALHEERLGTARSFQRSQSLLYQNPSGNLSEPAQPGGKEALMQTGILLIQEMMAKRSKSKTGTDE